MNPADVLIERIATGLSRRSIVKCSQWSEKYRVMGQPYPGPWTFNYHPWTRSMCDEDGDWVGQKSAQMGFTEVALNRVFYTMDIKQSDCLYVLPAKTPDAGDFSSGRFDSALQLSRHLENMFSDVRNIGHKKAGHVNLYIRGSRSRAGLKSIPTGQIIFDEVDEMNQENIPLAEERASGQTKKQNIKISTPRIDNFGINRYYKDSTQDHFFFPCPHCSKHIELTFEACVKVLADNVTDPKLMDSYLTCPECKVILDHETKPEFLGCGEWVPKYPNRALRGFHINQLYSPTVTPGELARSYLRSLNDHTEEQEFYNSKLGLCHAVKGARLTDSEINQCRGDHKLGAAAGHGGLITMGVDVGSKFLHYVITQWFALRGRPYGDINMDRVGRMVAYGTCHDFDELDRLMYSFHVTTCVIDANPERRKATEFANRFYGAAHICFYGNSMTGKDIHVHSDDPAVTVDRTSWLDQSLGRFRRKTISIPADTQLEFISQLKAQVRIYEKDKNGNPVGRYVTGNEDDHYGHANNYCEIALALSAEVGKSKDMESPV